MVKEKKGMPKWLKRTIGAVAILLVVGIALVIFFNNANAAMNNKGVPDTVTLSKGDITKSVSVSGVVESDSVTNVYSTQSYPVQEIFIEVGDTVKKGDVLAVLDFSKLENDIAQAEINLKSAELSAEVELTNNGNSTINAQTSLASAEISLGRQELSTSNASSDLSDARADLGDFDSYTYDKAITDAEVTLARKTQDLKDAQEDYDEAMNAFDDYTYQNTIKEAAITLQRKKDDLETAEDDLADAEAGSDDEFDDYSYQSAITSAENNISKAESSYSSARRSYQDALDSGDEATITKAESTLETAATSVDDAYIALDKAKDDLKHARNTFYDNLSDTDEKAVENAEKAVETAGKALDDAQRSYDKALSDRNRAQTDAVDSTRTKLTTAQNNLEDAQRAYNKAINDKIKAAADYDDTTNDKIKSAQKTLSDSQKQLESSRNSLTSAENSLSQAANKVATSGSSVELQRLSLEKLYTNLEECTIYATADGVITEKNLKVGATPTGVLFVIEDVDDLYISANVKEYNLSQISLSQESIVTTDATGNTVYSAAVSYISPKAVSAAGSTSVEFEVRAKLAEPDGKIKIGMNAYLNIITDTKKNVFTVALSTISTESGQSYVYAYDNATGETVKMPVTVGIKSTTSTEISGDQLYEGMTLVSDPDTYFAEPTVATGMVMTGMGG